MSISISFQNFTRGSDSQYDCCDSAQAQGKSYPLCPCCYNNPPDFAIANAPSADRDRDGGNEETIAGGSSSSGGADSGKGTAPASANGGAKFLHSGCNSCLHPSCKHSAVQNSMCECPSQADSGEPCPVSIPQRIYYYLSYHKLNRTFGFVTFHSLAIRCHAMHISLSNF